MKNTNVIYTCWGALIVLYIIYFFFAINPLGVTEADTAQIVDYDDYEIDVYVPLTREQQIKLMGECIEDAIAVCQDANIYPIGNWYREDEIKSGDKQVILAAEIAVAFFNYRTRDK